MSAHRAPRRRRSLRDVPVRVLLCLGLLLGFGAVGTMAYWTDTGTLTGGSFTAGTLDVGLDAALAGPGGTYAATTFAAGNLVPGESAAFTLQVKNLGSVPFTYTARGTSSGELATSTSATSAQRLQLTVKVGSTGSTTGAESTHDRVGSCSASGTQTYSGPLGATDTSVVPTAQTIATGGTQNVCLLVTLPSAAPNALQGKSATTTLVVDAKQVGAP